MSIIFQSSFIIVLFVFVRAGDLAISAAIARDTIRAIVYGVVSILALIALILMIGIH